MNIKRILISKPIILLEIIILGYFMFNVGQEMYKRQTIEAQITKLENDIGKLENDKNDINSLLSYVQTDVFVEQEAREKLNLAKAEESLILLPNADNPDAVVDNPELNLAAEAEPGAASRREKSNLTKWWQYFFEHERLALE